jgi:hypothetical protein
MYAQTQVATPSYQQAIRNVRPSTGIRLKHSGMEGLGNMKMMAQ